MMEFNDPFFISAFIKGDRDSYASVQDIVRSTTRLAFEKVGDYPRLFDREAIEFAAEYETQRIQQQLQESGERVRLDTYAKAVALLYARQLHALSNQLRGHRFLTRNEMDAVDRSAVDKWDEESVYGTLFGNQNSERIIQTFSAALDNLPLRTAVAVGRYWAEGRTVESLAREYQISTEEIQEGARNMQKQLLAHEGIASVAVLLESTSKEENTDNLQLMEYTEGLKDLLVDELYRLYDAEHQVVRALSRISDFANTLELRKQIVQHTFTAESHIRRLEQIFSFMSTKQRAKKNLGMAALVEEGIGLMNEFRSRTNSKDVQDLALISTVQKLDRLKNADYISCASYSEALGLTEIAKLLDQLQSEEQINYRQMTKQLETSINPRYGKSLSK